MLTDFFSECVLQDRRTQPDGMGGVIVTYTDGALVRLGIVKKSSTEAEIAYQSGTKTIYTVVFPALLSLPPGERFKRLSDGKVFRVTSDGEDMQPPKFSALKCKQCTAEVVAT